MWTPFAIDAKGGEMKTKGEMQTKREHELLSSMTKGEIVDEIVIDANMGLQRPLRCPCIFFGSLLCGGGHTCLLLKMTL